MWRDPNCAGTVKPWVPIEMQSWVLHSSLHASTYVAGSPPTEWTELINSSGSITVHDGVIDVDSGMVANTSYGILDYVPPSGWAAGHDIRVIIRTAQTDESVAGWYSIRIMDNRSGLTVRAGLVPSRSGALRLENALTGANQGVEGADAGVTMQTWDWGWNGDTSSDLSIVRNLEDVDWRAWCPGFTNSATADAIQIWCQCAPDPWPSGPANGAAFETEWIAIYSKAQ
jgi:hypothetical protein